MITVKPEHFYLFNINVEFCLSGKCRNLLFSNNILDATKSRIYQNRYSYYCKAVYIGYNNNHYKAKDFGIYLLHNALFNIEFLSNPKLWNVDDIPKIVNLYTEKILKQNIEVVKEVLKRINLTDQKKIGIIQSTGTSLLFDWMKAGYISPIYLIMNYNLLTDGEGEIEEHKNMRKIIPLFEKIYKQRTIE